jgi:phage protein D
MNRHTGSALDELAHLRQSIEDILTTPIGSRVMRRAYGSQLFELIDQPLNDQTRLRAYSGVRAYYYDVNGSERMEAIVGGEENAKTLRHTYANRSSALRAARSEWKKIQRGSATLSFTLARGRPELVPELSFTLHGIKPEITAINWLGETVTHSLSQSAYTSRLELQSGKYKNT